jgi:hypothetical protein
MAACQLMRGLQRHSRYHDSSYLFVIPLRHTSSSYQAVQTSFFFVVIPLRHTSSSLSHRSSLNMLKSSTSRRIRFVHQVLGGPPTELLAPQGGPRPSSYPASPRYSSHVEGPWFRHTRVIPSSYLRCDFWPRAVFQQTKTKALMDPGFVIPASYLRHTFVAIAGPGTFFGGPKCWCHHSHSQPRPQPRPQHATATATTGHCHGFSHSQSHSQPQPQPPQPLPYPQARPATATATATAIATARHSCHSQAQPGTATAVATATVSHSHSQPQPHLATASHS